MSSKKIIILNIFSERLNELIKIRLHISQKAFAKNIGITANYLSMVLNGKSGPSADMIAGIYIHYNGYLNWLLTGNQPEHAIAPTFDCPNDFIRELCKDIIDIFTSDNKGVKDALRQNIKEFRESIQKDKDLKELKERIGHVEIQLKKLMDPELSTGTATAGGTGRKRTAA